MASVTLVFKLQDRTAYGNMDDGIFCAGWIWECAVREAGSTTQLLEFTNLKPIGKSSDEPKTMATAIALEPSFKYADRGDSESAEYSVFNLINGLGFS
jgi:hypothetical protein